MRRYKGFAALCALSIAAPISVAGAEEYEHGHGAAAHDSGHSQETHAQQGHAQQQFLFLLDPAYVQEQGRTQAGLRLSLEPDDATDWVLEAEVEYGITDRLQIQAAVPFIDAAHSGIGDIEFGATYALIEETQARPQVSIVAEAIAPTGDVEDGLGHDAWGFAIGVTASKQVASGVFFHGGVTHEWVNGAMDDHHHEFDENEWVLGAGVVAPLTHGAEIALEIERTRIEEETSTASHIEYQTDASLGVIFTRHAPLEFGTAVVFGVDGDQSDASAVFKMHYEW